MQMNFSRYIGIGLFALATGGLGAENLISNPDFEHDAAGYMIGDGTRFEERQHRFVPFGEKRALEILFEAPKDNQWDYCLRNDVGLYTPEVPLEAGKEYIFEFKAKSSRDFVPLFCSEYFPYQGAISYIGGVQTVVNLNQTWQTIRLKVRSDSPRWSGFRIFRRLDRCPAASGEVLSLADFYFGPADKREENKNVGQSASLSFQGDPMYLCRHPGEDPLMVDVLLINRTTRQERRKIDFQVVSKEENRVIRRFSKEVIFRPGRSVESFPLEIPHYYGVLKLEGTLEEKPLINSLKFTVSPKLELQKGELPIELGINHLPSVPEKRFSIDQQMKLFREGGFRYIRSWDTGNAFMWFRIEPEEGKFDWDRTDYLVNTAERNQLEIFPILAGEFALHPDQLPLGTKKPYGHNLPNWVCQKSSLVPFPGSCWGPNVQSVLPPMEIFNRMVEALGQRYKGKIHLWEVLNESELYLSQEMYIPYLKNAYRILKQIDSDNTVIGGGLTGDFGADISHGLYDFLRKGGLGNIDGLSFHPYGSLYEDQGGRMPSTLLFDNVRNIFQKIGHPIPLWNTEVYYLSPQSVGGGSSRIGPVFHPGYLIRRILIDASEGVAAVMALPGNYYIENLINDHVTGDYIGSMFGNRVIPSDKYVASAVFADSVKNLKFDRIIDIPGQCRAYCFTGKNRAVALFFALNPEKEDSRKVNFPVRTDVVLKNILGNPLCESEWQASPIPIYLVADSAQILQQYLKSLQVEGADKLQIKGMRVTEKQQKLFMNVEIAPGSAGSFELEGVEPVKVDRSQKFVRVSLPDDWKFVDRKKREGSVVLGSSTFKFRISREFDVPALTSVPSVHSSLDSSVWREGLEVHPWHARARLGHFGGKLYFAVDVKDDTPFRKSVKPEQALWQSDSVELFIDAIPFEDLKFTRYAIHAGPTRHLYFASPAKGEKALAAGASPEFLKKLKWQFLPLDNGYRFWAEIDPLVLGGQSGKALGFDYAVNDWDEKGNRRNPSMSGYKDQCIDRMTFNILNFKK